MTETAKQLKQRGLKELEGKNIAHYSVLLSAFINNKMELDKTLVTLSAAAIGLLVTILTAVGVENRWEIPLFMLAVLSFLTTIWCSLQIYKFNSAHLEAVIRGSAEKDKRLKIYDKWSIWAFFIGSFSALLIGVLSAYSQLHNKEEDIMSKKTSPTTVSKQVFLRDSVDGITNLSPQITQKPSQPQNSEKAGTTGQSTSGDSARGTAKE